tara:strand:- start:5050 stop:5904 length:855 start_codon:yes stop_codon:yes gene_type:complete
MKYGNLPYNMGVNNTQCNEMMFIQYLPIKLASFDSVKFEERLSCFDGIIGEICSDFIKTFGRDKWNQSYVYLTAKHMYQPPNSSFNRHGYHTDGFLTDDINYIWSDKFPTIFNTTNFNLTLDDRISIGEMEEQAKPENEVIYPDKSIVRLNQYNIHKVGDSSAGGMRTFIKVSFSKDKYDLIGNAHNYLLDYDWVMKNRSVERNIPQTIIQEDDNIKNIWVTLSDIATNSVLEETYQLEPVCTLNTIDAFEVEYEIRGDRYKIIYKIKDDQKPNVYIKTNWFMA